ncbi:DUF6890 family protein [Aeromonas enteropelogenes]
MLTLRRHYLPHDDDSTESLARALWLHRQQREQQLDAVAGGIAKAFGG